MYCAKLSRCQSKAQTLLGKAFELYARVAIKCSIPSVICFLAIYIYLTTLNIPNKAEFESTLPDVSTVSCSTNATNLTNKFRHF